jgi:hypothetical protein
MATTQRVRRLGQRTWLGTIHVYIDAARRELNYGGRQLLYRDIRALLARYEAEEARQGTKPRRAAKERGHKAISLAEREPR